MRDVSRCKIVNSKRFGMDGISVARLLMAPP
jgi:hypothetical protein